MIDIFKIGFISFTFFDLIDILIVSFIVYNLFKLLKGTFAAQIFVGLLIVLFLSFSAQALNLRGVNLLLKFITDIWLIAFIIVFQPEIRRLLALIAKNPFLTLGNKNRKGKKSVTDEIVDAAFYLSQLQHGALIVIARMANLQPYIEGGLVISAKVSKDLICSIFYPRSPLHDGAVIIQGEIVEAARCTLPLTQTTMVDGESLGMRHRAGLGMSENTDSICVIVSEETGSVSTALEGKLIKGYSKDSLRNFLDENLVKSEVKTWKINFFKKRKKETDSSNSSVL